MRDPAAFCGKLSVEREIRSLSVTDLHAIGSGSLLAPWISPRDRELAFRDVGSGRTMSYHVDLGLSLGFSVIILFSLYYHATSII